MLVLLGIIDFLLSGDISRIFRRIFPGGFSSIFLERKCAHFPQQFLRPGELTRRSPCLVSYFSDLPVKSPPVTADFLRVGSCRKVFLASILRGLMPREWGAASRVTRRGGALLARFRT